MFLCAVTHLLGCGLDTSRGDWGRTVRGDSDESVSVSHQMPVEESLQPSVEMELGLAA